MTTAACWPPCARSPTTRSASRSRRGSCSGTSRAAIAKVITPVEPDPDRRRRRSGVHRRPAPRRQNPDRERSGSSGTIRGRAAVRAGTGPRSSIMEGWKRGSADTDAASRTRPRSHRHRAGGALRVDVHQRQPLAQAGARPAPAARASRSRPRCPRVRRARSRTTAVDQAVNIIRNRVDGLGVAESTVTRQGTGAGSTILVEVPGKNQKDLGPKIGKTAKMSFREVLLSCPSRGRGRAVAVGDRQRNDQSQREPDARRPRSPRPPSATSSSNGRPATGLKAAPRAVRARRRALTASASAATTGDATATCASGLNGPTVGDRTGGGRRGVRRARLQQGHRPEHRPRGRREREPRHLRGGRHREVHPRPAASSRARTCPARRRSSTRVRTAAAIPTWTVLLNFNSDGAKVFGDTTRALVRQALGHRRQPVRHRPRRPGQLGARRSTGRSSTARRRSPATSPSRAPTTSPTC